ncbi:MAG: lipid II:glycine glycyltransferase FemX [Candidatus Acidiferrales bacterium]
MPAGQAVALQPGMMETQTSRAKWASDGLVWIKDPPAAEWDCALATLRGHPLQSSVWGRARAMVHGVVEHRWLLRCGDKPVWMIRVEERKIGPIAKIAWAPRGPAGETAELSLSTPPGFSERLRAEGFSLLITNPWINVNGGAANSTDDVGGATARTIWLDLSQGADAIFQNLHTQTRKGVRRAARSGVVVETASESARIGEFVDLCASISDRKGFKLQVTPAMIATLLRLAADSEHVKTAQFISLKDGQLGSGLFVICVGRNMHQIWGATNRDLRHERVGEACQWATIEWAVALGCTRYDLEGIDPINNPSVYEFKKRFGGKEMTLYGYKHLPLSGVGRIASIGHKAVVWLRR